MMMMVVMMVKRGWNSENTMKYDYNDGDDDDGLVRL